MLHVADAAVKYHQVPPVYIIFFSSFLCCLASTPQMLTKLFVPVFQHLVLLKREASINRLTFFLKWQVFKELN